MAMLRTILKWAGLVMGGLLALAVVLALLGMGYGAIAAHREAVNYPAPGKLVDIGGYRLHLNCMGTSAPAVIFDSGLGGTSLDWSLVQPGIAKITRACSYDRAGMGWSDVGPAPRSPKQIAKELQALLTKAKIAGPYVLVGHSLGGKNVRLFAAEHPDEGAGMGLEIG